MDMALEVCLDKVTFQDLGKTKLEVQEGRRAVAMVKEEEGIAVTTTIAPWVIPMTHPSADGTSQGLASKC